MAKFPQPCPHPPQQPSVAYPEEYVRLWNEFVSQTRRRVAREMIEQVVKNPQVPPPPPPKKRS